MYQLQEILEDLGPFDGFTVDLWAVGVIMFIMLTGFPPWERACRRTNGFYQAFVHYGSFQPLLRRRAIGLSGEAMDLMQRMLFLNPQGRLSLDQIRAHPWMLLPMELPPPR
jgi:serine/threonine protein kinase